MKVSPCFLDYYSDLDKIYVQPVSTRLYLLVINFLNIELNFMPKRRV